MEMKLLVYSLVVYLITEETMAQNIKCGGSNINSRTTICCNGLAYVKSGPKPGCCGSVGFDAHHYYCCGNTIIRKDKYKVPRCCGEKGYDGMFDVCVDGYLDRKSELGSHCCMTEMGWKCCPRGGTCCQYAGSGQVEIPGFRPACCELRSYTEKAECCANTVEMTGVMPSCCDNEQYRPKCCVGNDGSSECCPANTGTCCRHLITYPEPYRPKPTNPPYRQVYPIAATRPPYSASRSAQRCCSSTRRTCCSKPISRDAVQPCCYSLTKPSCCYTIEKYQQSCCIKKTGTGNKLSGMPNLKTAKVGGRYNGMRTAKVGGGNQYNAQTGASYSRGRENNQPHYRPPDNRYNYNRPSDNQNNYDYNRGRPSGNQNNNDNNSDRPSYNQNNYGYNTGRPSDNQNNYDYNRGRPSDNQNNYDYNRGRPSGNQNNYDYNRGNKNNNNRARPSDNQNDNQYNRDYQYNRGRPSYNRPHTDQNQRGRPSYNQNKTERASHQNQYRSCCNALSQTMCCSEGYRATGRVPSCCPSSTSNGKMRPMYRTPDPVFVPEGNQAFQGIHFNMHPTDWAPEEEIINPNMYYPHRGSSQIRTKLPEMVRPKTTDKPDYTTKGKMYIDINVYKPRGPTTPREDLNAIDNVETVTPYPVDQNIVTKHPGYTDARTLSDINEVDNNLIYDTDKSTEKPFPYLPGKDRGFISESELEEPVINDEDEDETLLIPVPEEPPLYEFKPDYYGNYFDKYDYEHMKCNGEPYDLGVHICCDGVLRFRIGVEPKCCSTEAYDAFLYKCCDGVIRRSCDPKYEPQKTAWGKFI